MRQEGGLDQILHESSFVHFLTVQIAADAIELWSLVYVLIGGRVVWPADGRSHLKWKQFDCVLDPAYV